LKSGRQRVFKKDVAAILPCTKENLFTFSKRRPEALRQYKEGLEKLEKRGVGVALSREEEMLVANSLRAALKSILPGDKDAHEYHKLMAGILEFLFFPNLLCPRLEREIHDGRKRIDIAMENGAWEGIFHRLSATRGLPCSYVFFECKNYSRDIQNPELDQMSGRFSPRRGQLGFVCCRAFRDRSRFVDRCRDTFRDQRGLVIALDDEIIMGWLRLVHDNDRQGVDGGISHLVDEVWLEA
jgi:hypothetical protein